MQPTKSSSLFGFGLMLMLLLLSVSAMAQESSGFPNDDNKNPYEVNQTLDSHGNVIREGATQRDSLFVKPVITVKPKTNEAAATKPKTQEEPLSFNFLYYIIQKFKGSDVVD
jgi:hypothetical protein